MLSLLDVLVQLDEKTTVPLRHSSSRSPAHVLSPLTPSPPRPPFSPSWQCRRPRWSIQDSFQFPGVPTSLTRERGVYLVPDEPALTLSRELMRVKWPAGVRLIQKRHKKAYYHKRISSYGYRGGEGQVAKGSNVVSLYRPDQGPRQARQGCVSS